MTNVAYVRTVNELKEVASGKRGWGSLTKAARDCGLPKEQLKIVAEALGLNAQNHGNHGLTARRR